MAEKKSYDVLIAGAGPSGCACALMLADSGLSIALLDKDVFPREKTCGDGIGVDVINQFKKMPGNLVEKLQQIKDKEPIYGVRLYSPDSNHIDLEFRDMPGPRGYCIPRIEFDMVLLSAVKETGTVDVLEDHTIESAEILANSVVLTTDKGIFEGQLVIGGDGPHSVIAKQLAGAKKEVGHTCICVKTYFENVEPIEPSGLIELYFVKELLPYYLWIFPMANNRFNVGLGMLQTHISTRNINLKSKFEELISDHPVISPRFKKAMQLTKLEGGIIPLGTQKKTISGNRFLLTGDAASLPEPFLEEGIGNAIRSGRIAATHIKNCFEKEQFSAGFNKSYDGAIYNAMWNELETNRKLRTLAGMRRMFNLVVRKANRHPEIKEVLKAATHEVDIKKKLKNPRFILKIFFG